MDTIYLLLPRIEALHKQLAEAMNELTEAAVADIIADEAYNEALAFWQEQNRDLVKARDNAILAKYQAELRRDELLKELKDLLEAEWLPETLLPNGLAQVGELNAVYDAQGFVTIATRAFPFLLKLDDKAVQNFFVREAEQQSDGSYLLPENIRVWASVEVLSLPKAKIDTMTVFKCYQPVPKAQKEPAWEAPDNFHALLTAPELPEFDEPFERFADTQRLLPEKTKELPLLDDDSSEGESMLVPVPSTESINF